MMDDGKHAFRTRQGGLQPLGAVAAPQGETRPVRLTNRLRNLAAGALASHLILSDNVTERARRTNATAGSNSGHGRAAATAAAGGNR
ncbi:hypothetical protein IUJ34_00605 [Klebsiella pneumoniae subsp. pneumoniae]|uniref:Uncharacterized protein n=1 Tax=Klebsiella pneumoniae subsp. pneumoniae TaxID=72407 RepID=A0A7S9E0Z6_KLEPN|nr:hypothetical protein IUJ34_00605 [Klebsiella pneumoniae subsp. pneumoniae]